MVVTESTTNSSLLLKIVKSTRSLLRPAAVRPNFPAHVHWQFGESRYASSVAAGSSSFRYWFTPSLKKGAAKPFRDEVRRACLLLDAKRDGRTVALCFSGGLDSEILARTLLELEIPFKPYFLDLWGINRQAFDSCGVPFLKGIGKRAIEVPLSRARLLEQHSRKVFADFACEYPTYVAMTYLFEQIPAEEFILVGDGDFCREGPLFDSIGKTYPYPGQGIALPFASSSVFYYLWAAKHRRAGEYYFFSSTPELIGAMIENPLFQFAYPSASTRAVILESFPEAQPRPRTTNWEGDAAYENKRVRRWLSRYARTERRLAFWRDSQGTVVDLSRIYL